MLIHDNDKTTLYWKQNKDDKPIRVCNYFEVTRVIKKIPSTCNDEVEVRTFDGKNEKFFRIDLESISDVNEVVSCCSKNYLIFSQAYKLYIHDRILFQTQEIIINEIFSYENTCLGWRDFDGKKVFFYDETILPNGKVAKCIIQRFCCFYEIKRSFSCF